MKSMTALLFTLICSSSMAIDLGDILDQLGRQGQRDPMRDRRGDIQCRATDRGYEEHWGGHSSCGECLGKHGRCVQTCEELVFVCEAQGIDQSGVLRAETAQGSSRWRTEERALRRCDRYYRSCRVARCDQRREVISREDCRQGQPGRIPPSGPRRR